MTVTCPCGVVLSKRVHQKIAAGMKVTGLCRPCYEAHVRVTRQCGDCGAKLAKIGAVRCQPCNNRWLAKDKGREERRIAACRAAFYRPEVRASHNLANKLNGRRKLAWLPDQHRGEYFRLMKRMPAAEAKSIILSRMEPFERQLALVASGAARVVAVPQMPSRGHDFTLGGCTDWSGL